MKKTVVVDLDGTLLNTNTFEHYIIFTTKAALKKLDLWTAIMISILVVLRMARIISTHEKMKFHILRRSARYTSPKRMRDLTEKMKNYENVNVVSLIEKYRKMGYLTVLSTAAPKPYAKIISSDYGFDSYCATEMPQGSNWRENVNEQKKTNTLDLLKNIGGELSVLVTDHYDDLPLLYLPKECNYIVNPTDKTKQYLEDNDIEYCLL